MQKFHGLALVSLVMLFIGGCTTTGVQSVGGDEAGKQKRWQQRSQQLGAVSSWGLDGRGSVTYADQNLPFGLVWQQQSQTDGGLKIQHPLTRRTLAELTLRPGSATLKTDRGQVVRGSSAENLIEQQLRVRIPVEGMQFWVRGLASTAYPVSRLQLDNSGRPVFMQQAGWDIRYTSYNSASLTALPRSVTISRQTPQPVRIKFSIKNWR